MVETNTRKVTDRLKADGWIGVGGGKHDKYEHAARPGALIILPRHKVLSPGGRVLSQSKLGGLERVS